MAITKHRTAIKILSHGRELQNLNKGSVTRLAELVEEFLLRSMWEEPPLVPIRRLFVGRSARLPSRGNRDKGKWLRDKIIPIWILYIRRAQLFRDARGITIDRINFWGGRFPSKGKTQEDRIPHICYQIDLSGFKSRHIYPHSQFHLPLYEFQKICVQRHLHWECDLLLSHMQQASMNMARAMIAPRRVQNTSVDLRAWGETGNCSGE